MLRMCHERQLTSLACLQAVWMIINLSLFLFNYYKFHGDDWNHMRAVVHDGLPVARGAAGVINFNAALILVPVCRNFVNFLRGCFGVRACVRACVRRQAPTRPMHSPVCFSPFVAVAVPPVGPPPF